MGRRSEEDEEKMEVDDCQSDNGTTMKMIKNNVSKYKQKMCGN